MTPRQQRVSDFMVEVHRISRALADAHAAAMDEEELQFRLRMYERMTEGEKQSA